MTKVFPIFGAGFAFEGCAITDSWCGVLLLRGARLVLPGAGFALVVCAISSVWCGVCFCGMHDQFCWDVQGSPAWRMVFGIVLACLFVRDQLWWCVQVSGVTECGCCSCVRLCGCVCLCGCIFC